MFCQPSLRETPSVHVLLETKSRLGSAGPAKSIRAVGRSFCRSLSQLAPSSHLHFYLPCSSYLFYLNKSPQRPMFCETVLPIAVGWVTVGSLKHLTFRKRPELSPHVQPLPLEPIFLKRVCKLNTSFSLAMENIDITRYFYPSESFVLNQTGLKMTPLYVRRHAPSFHTNLVAVSQLEAFIIKELKKRFMTSQPCL